MLLACLKQACVQLRIKIKVRILTLLNKQMILNIIIAVVALVLGGLCGYFIFRYVLTGKYNEMISAAQKKLKC